MPYIATAVSVLIASPGDVATERNIMRNTIHEWNAVHSQDRGLILTPIGWDTHSFPQVGDRPQALINKQIVEQCDLLIAVFWTRIGTPTGEADSGTVEEIEKHVSSGKPAMLYFSNVPVRPDSVDGRQYAALRAFRAAFEKRGLIDTYSSIEEFRAKLTRQLAQTVITGFGHLSNREAAIAEKPLVVRSPQLSDTGRQLLAEVTRDRNRTSLMVAVMDGRIVQTNGKQLSTLGDARSEAQWKGAVRELVSSNLLESQGSEGEVFRLTDRGYAAADELGINAAAV